MTNFQLYLLGWKGMWYVLAIFIVLVVITYLLERRDKLEEERLEEAHRRKEAEGVRYRKYSA